MKKNRFFFLLQIIILLFTIHLSITAQKSSCGTPPLSNEDREAIIKKLRLGSYSRNGTCSDPTANFTTNYKLILEYAVKSDGTRIPSPSQMEQLKEFINAHYNPHGIFFTYFEFPVSCDNCQFHNTGNWGRIDPTLNATDFLDCLWGRLVEAPGSQQITGQANTYFGRFWAKYDPNDLQTIIHELGHALGLHHTFSHFLPSDKFNNEHIVQDGSSGCSCNCNTTGDLICDTQVDPFFIDHPDWNGLMFNYGLPFFRVELNNTYPQMHRLDAYSPPNCILSTIGTNVYYDKIEFSVSVSGEYTISTSTGILPYLHLYENTFDPTSPCINIKQVDFGSMSVLLNNNTNYTLVVASANNNILANYTLRVVSSPGQIISNRRLYPSGIMNSNDEVDFCNDLYSNDLLDANQIMTNIMSYHINSSTVSEFNFTNGQVSFMKLYNQGKPWEGTATNSGTMEAGFTVNQPTVISTPLNITGDIEINSSLTILNTTLSFMDNAKIIMKPGGKLILDNGHLDLFGGMACMPEAERWQGIKALEPGLVQISLKNRSSISNADTAIEGKGSTLIVNIASGSRINSFFTSAIDIDGKYGSIKVSGESVINGKITLKNIYSGISLNNSTINIPQITNNQATQGNVFINNASFVVLNNSNINAEVLIENFGTQPINVRNSSLAGGVFIKSANSKVVIRDNIFTIGGNSLIVQNVKDYDVYNNIITGANGCNSWGYFSTAPLYFKNRFVSSSNSFKNTNEFSAARLECNDMIGQGTRDLNLLEPIYVSQGNKNQAAGNSFSRTPDLEVNYLGGTEIKYFYHNKGTEEPININQGAMFSKNLLDFNITTSACDNQYPNTLPIPDHCLNGVMDGDETGVDCGGSCPKCFDSPYIPFDCTNGVLDIGEEGVDCGGICPPCTPLCENGIFDAGEEGIDCGGTCPPCVSQTNPSCTDGIMNGNETGIDCGGPNCAPCDLSHCSNGIQDNGETGIDCGGSCPPCSVAHCSNGIQDGDETGIDCGGSCPDCIDLSPLHCNNGVMDGDETGIDCGGSCPPCTTIYPSHCNNGLWDGDETGIDCGGSCPPCGVPAPPHCFNGKMDGNETGIDCGGDCPPCSVIPPNGGGNEGGSTGAARYSVANHADFVQQISGIYGEGFMTGDRYQVAQDLALHRSSLDGGHTCDVRSFIAQESANHPEEVIQLIVSLSPNVSPAVIHALFEHSQYFSSSDMANILSLNPAVITDRYISYIIFKTNTFSDTEKNLILNAVSNGDTRTDFELLLSYKNQYQNAIIRDNIAMITLNSPIDFNAVRAELATDPSPYRIFDVAQSYADQGRYDLAQTTLESADLCEITDPIYRAQLTGLSDIYAYEQSLIDKDNSTLDNRGIWAADLLTREHGIATDMSAYASGQKVMIKDRWQYAPLIFSTPTSTHSWSIVDIDVYPNPAYNMLNIDLKNNTYNSSYLRAQITNGDGKVIKDFDLSSELYTLDISMWSSGLYTVKVLEQDHLVFVSKFIKIQ